MKKLIFSALVATGLLVSSCGKDNNDGGSTSLTGDWYTLSMYNLKESLGEYNWYAPNQCAKQTCVEISDKVLKYKLLYEERGTCKENFVYYDYTTSNGVFHLTVRADSPADRKGNIATVNYEMKDKELILRFKNKKGDNEIQVLHKQGVDYSHLDPLVGYWRLTKVQRKTLNNKGEVEIKEYPAGNPTCFRGDIVASSMGFSIFYTLPNNNVQCGSEERKTFDWAREGNTYYNVSNGQKVPMPFSFSNNNQTLSFGSGDTILVFQK